ncbi:MAG: molybdenum cofactor biosynthesis protein [Gracilibacter sp. BRH_c7a]|nr:MAG: molybdenum cofactor biosynthesis protein [Gracilibacter sp. BRH_c7a]
MNFNITLEEAQNLILGRCQPVETEYVDLNHALGRILGKDIRAKENIPPFSRSPYDGYAFRAADTLEASKANPVTLEIIEEVPAGYAAQKKINIGQAVKILTGAPIPEGADAVTKYEETKSNGTYVEIYTSCKSGENIVPAGEDVAIDEVIAYKGTVISPPVVGLMSALGITKVEVHKRPRIGIISTGDELLDITEPLSPGKIRNSNAYALAAYCKELGAEPVILGNVCDKTEEVAMFINRGLAEADMVITTGGVSVGDYDVVGDAVKAAGAETLFWKIEIKPGSPSLAAVKDGKLILALSGSPAAAMVIYQLVGIILIKKLAGWSQVFHQQTEVILKKDFRKASPRRRFLRGKLVMEDGVAYVETIGGQGNGVLRSLIGCDILAEIPAGSGPLKAGEKLTGYLLY